MSVRSAIYRSVCALLGLYAAGAAAYAVQWTRGDVFGSRPLLLHLGVHAFLLAMASLRAARPARAGSPGGLLLTLAMALAIVSGQSVRIDPDWMSALRLGLLGVGYLALRMTAPSPARPEDARE